MRAREDTRVIEYRGVEYRRAHSNRYYVPYGRWSSVPDREALHRDVWSDANGKIPEGHHVHHVNGDYDDNSIENLVCLPAKEHMRLHSPSEEARTKAAEWHRSEEGRKWHSENGKQAWVGREPATVFCEVCGTEYETLVPSRSRFCSNACKSQRRRDAGIDNTTKECPICGIEFTANKYRSPETCSRACGGRLRSQRYACGLQSGGE